jgi:DNA-binding IclR family transcriptional regulator
MTNAEPAGRGRRRLESFARGLDILAAITTRGVQRADAVAAAVGLPVSTTYRYISALVDAGFVIEIGGTYAPGPRALEMSRSGTRYRRLMDVAQPVLRWLVKETGETALLTVRAGTAALCLDRVESPQPVRLSFEPGAQLPLYASASGKVLLAHAPSSLIDEVLQSVKPFTPNTPDAARVRADLAEIVGRGYAVTVGELDEQAIGAAAPILVGREMVGAVTVAGPLFRLIEPDVERIVGLVTAGARRIGSSLAAGEDALASAGGG